MPFLVDEETGKITTVQGDSGEINVFNLPDDADYEVYFSFYDKNRRILGQEMPVRTSFGTKVTIFVSSALTDLLKVNANDEFAEYYYGIKICDPETGYEDTLCIGTKDIGELNTVIVYPKQVEGMAN